MDHPDIMSHHCDDSHYREAFNSEHDYASAVEEAIKLHCKGMKVPEDIARFCRTEAVNLDRDLARSRGEEVPEKMPGQLDDYSKA